MENLGRRQSIPMIVAQSKLQAISFGEPVSALSCRYNYLHCYCIQWNLSIKDILN